MNQIVQTVFNLIGFTLLVFGVGGIVFVLAVGGVYTLVKKWMAG